ncbi:MAG: hypothetical protein AAFS07_05670 [Pseudomonadota bacterium]
MTDPAVARVQDGDATQAASLDAFLRDGFLPFDRDPRLAAWVTALRPHARRLAQDPALVAQWLRCGGSWFAGVGALGNTPDGALPAARVPPLACDTLDFAREALGFGAGPLDLAQLSIPYAGYPAAPAEGESEAAFRFRRDRDAAHVDGLERDAARRRRLGEAHAFILGIPLEETPQGAAPMVVWQGSHHLIRAALQARLAGIAPADWPAEDITEAYQAARRAVFERCPRVVLQAQPGEAYLVHRLAVHGVAPWPQAVPATQLGRPVVYFRPEVARDFERWLADP